MNEIEALKTEITDLKEEIAELEAIFDLRWKADMRAIERWREGHPERSRVMPDHADMVVWLLEQLDKKESKQ